MTKNEGLKSLKQLFQNSADIKFVPNTFNGKVIHFILCEKMYDAKLLNEVVVPRIQNVLQQAEDQSSFEEIIEQLHLPELKEIAELKEAEVNVYKGFLLLYFEKENRLFQVNIINRPNRNPEETTSETTIKGPRDDFIEDLATNIALVRKRLPTHSLAVTKMRIGNRSKTDVAILYFEDIADPQMLNTIKQKISEIDTDVVVSGDLVLSHVVKNNTVFPQTDYTGRPDYAVQALARGRFVVMVEGVSYANVLPVNLLLLVKTAEDNDFPVAFTSAERLLRISSLLISCFLPGLWLALTTYHPSQLPFMLLATVVQANIGLPLPTALEMLLMLFLFELLREAGLRLPSIVGNTIGIVGGLIIGDAATRAGITSPAMIVIIATSTIATYTLVNQSLVTSVNMVRLYTIVCSAFFGLFGFIISLFLLLIYLSNMRTLGVPYLNIGADLSLSNISNTLLRRHSKAYTKRPKVLNPKDDTRSKQPK